MQRNGSKKALTIPRIIRVTFFESLVEFNHCLPIKLSDDNIGQSTTKETSELSYRNKRSWARFGEPLQDYRKGFY